MVSLAARPDLGDRAARWFSAHWGGAGGGIPGQHPGQPGPGPGVPQWYVTLSPPRGDCGGVGLIPRISTTGRTSPPTSAPSFVEEAWRGQGLARALLDLARREARAAGIPRLYLVTDHGLL